MAYMVAIWLRGLADRKYEIPARFTSRSPSLSTKHQTKRAWRFALLAPCSLLLAPAGAGTSLLAPAAAGGQPLSGQPQPVAGSSGSGNDNGSGSRHGPTAQAHEA
jgi:hypothetical protein